MQLGTPGMKFMVALDTGSDLFWVPCECSKCAPTQGSAYASVCFILTIYIYIFPCKLLFDSKGFPFAHFVLTCLRCIVESASQKSAMKKAL